MLLPKTYRNLFIGIRLVVVMKRFASQVMAELMYTTIPIQSPLYMMIIFYELCVFVDFSISTSAICMIAN